MSTFIPKNVMEKGHCYFLTYPHRFYIDVFERNIEEDSENISAIFTPQHLEDKIIKVFSKYITL